MNSENQEGDVTISIQRSIGYQANLNVSIQEKKI